MVLLLASKNDQNNNSSLDSREPQAGLPADASPSDTRPAVEPSSEKILDEMREERL
jgi:hypothetical protein